MLVDYRIYVTIYALLVPAYFIIAVFGMATIDNAAHQRLATRALVIDAALLGLTALIHFNDWLWS